MGLLRVVLLITLYSSLQRQQWEQSVDQHRHQTRGRFVGFLSLLGERRGARYSFE
jgi:hypothetical protein